MKPKKVIKFLRCELSQEEHRQAALSLARANEAMSAIEEEKKVATSQFAERIAQAKASIGKYSRVISNGYEMRNVECDVIYHTAVREHSPGWKQLYDFPQQKVTLRKDVSSVPNGDAVLYPEAAIVAVEAMSEAELQESFDFDQKEAQQAQPSAADLDQAADDYPHGEPHSTALPKCATCKTESVGKEGEVCDSCKADQAMAPKRGKANGKGEKSARASAERVSKTVATPADRQPEEEF